LLSAESDNAGATTSDQPKDLSLMLHQNNPNPFSKETEIRMSIPATVVQAVFYVYDLQGKALQRQIVSGRGDTSIKIEGGSLSAGMYLYTLIADGQNSDVKRMVLTE
jgi:hypothetical protein